MDAAGCSLRRQAGEENIPTGGRREGGVGRDATRQTFPGSEVGETFAIGLTNLHLLGARLDHSSWAIERGSCSEKAQ